MEAKLTSMFRRHPSAWYYTLLACAVTVAFLAVNAYLIASGKEAIWTQDHRSLYANFLVWACQTLDAAVQATNDGAPFELPMYTNSMGYGADVPVSMGAYLHDPINLIVAVIPLEYIGVSYPLMTLVRMILAAFAFSWFCFGHGTGRKATGVAALAYVTCGFVIMLGALRHPKFIDWAIILPLILKGADWMFQKKSPLLFCAAMFAQFCISIYFSYMSCIVLLVYCLIKYFAMPRDRSVGDFLALVGRFILYGLTAFLVSAVFSMPQIVALLSQGRVTSGKAAIPMLFSIKYYAKVAAHLIGADGTTVGMPLGIMSTIGVIAFAAGKKHFEPNEHRAWLIGALLCLAGTLLPFLSHVMNGMGYATDRWMLVTAFVCSYILCLTLPKLRDLEAREWKRIGIAVGAIAALTVLFAGAQIFLEDGPRAMIWPLCMTVAFLGAFFLMKKKSRVWSSVANTVSCAGIVIVCTALTCAFYCAPFGGNWISTFPKAGDTWGYITSKSPAAALEQTSLDGAPSRYSLPRVFDMMKNSPLAHNLMGVDYYTSFYIQHVDDYRRELGISDHYKNYSYVGSDSRLAVENLAGVKYYIAKERDFWRVPYGFSDMGIDYKKYHVFKNATTVPLAYLASGTMGREQYEQLTMAQKQEALMQRAVVDDEVNASLGQSPAPELSSREIDYKIAETKGLSIDEGVIHATDKNATLTLEFTGLPNSETYFSFENLNYQGYNPSRLAEAKGKEPSLKDRVGDLLWREVTTYSVMAAAGERTNTVLNATPQNQSYGGKVDWLFNLAYSEEPVTSVTVTFYERGDYTFDKMKIVCQPTEPIVQQASELSARALDNFEIGTNRMSADVSLEGDDSRIAVFSFAHTPGWSVKVDGQPATALRVNTAFLGVKVAGSGTHHIEWSYVTPGLQTGAYLSIAGIALLCALAIVGVLIRRNRRKQEAGA